MTMKMLAIDTSTDACSVALMIDGAISIDHQVVPQKHGATILPMVDSLMAEAGILVTQLDALVYGCGPGSFTGVRIGVATAQGIALGADIGVVGVSTLQNIAQGCYRQYGDTSIAVSVDARMDEVYYCEFNLDQHGLMHPCCDEQIMAPHSVPSPSAAYWAGSGAERYEQTLLSQFSVNSDCIRKHCLPHAQDALILGAAFVRAGKLRAAEFASPVYLRDKVAMTTSERAEKQKQVSGLKH